MSAPGRIRALAALALASAAVAGAFATMDASVAPSGALAGVCLALWLAEVVPPFVPTLLVVSLAPLTTGLPVGEVLDWVTDPVLLLFFGGFALGEAAAAHGIDRRIVAGSVRAARGRALPLVGIVLAATASLSMWISNVAAAALVLAALGPLLRERLARPLLLAVALGANLGGMATPIGTGPNGIALAALPEPPTFLAWMVLALPLTVAALLVAFAWTAAVHRVSGAVVVRAEPEPRPGERPWAVGAVAAAAIALWLSEPVHGLPAAAVSAGAAATLFGVRLLSPAHLARIDWSTLGLVAGGIGLGELLDRVGVVHALSARIVAADLPGTATLALLLLATAGLSSLMSNTAAVTLLVPVAAAALPEVPGVPILVALAASFGMPFVVSTPANAMAAGAGLPPADLLGPGILLALGGCAVLALTGPWVLLTLL